MPHSTTPVTRARPLDRSADYPAASFGGTLTDENQVITMDLPGNGAAFLGTDSANGDLFSAYQDGAMLLDLKVSSYGDSPNIQIRMDGTAGLDFGTFFTMDSNIVPDDDTWYRCILPVASHSGGQHRLGAKGALPERGLGLHGRSCASPSPTWP